MKRIDRFLWGKAWGGMITVEMAYLVPVILFVCFLSVTGIFYYHDKDLLTACAYEAAVVGSTKAREKDGVTQETVCALFRERIRGKCILFPDPQVTAEIGTDQIKVQVRAVKGAMSVKTEASAKITKPESVIRRYRRIGWNLQ